MDKVQDLAMKIRHEAVKSEHMHGIEALCWIVCPTLAVRRASEAEARRRLRDRMGTLSLDEILSEMA